jgi:murein DD-endopeptidase MepM/ murein hydrolase activator NlpD
LEKKWNRGILLALIVFLLAALFLPPVSATPLSDRKQELGDIRKEINEGKKELKELEEQEAELLAEIAAMEDSIANINAELALLVRQIKTTESEIEVTEAELLDAEIRLAEREDFLNRRIRAIYEMGRVNYLQVILEASSFTDFLSRFTHLQLIVDKDTYLLEAVQQEREEIAQQKVELEEKRDSLVKMRRKSLDKRKQLETQTAKREQLLKSVRDAYEEYEANIRAMEKEVKEIERVIKELEEAQRRANRSNNSGPAGQLLWPVPGYTRITSPFGYRIHPITGKPGTFHGGIDIGAPRGATILAAESGSAYSYSSPSGYGNYVIIIHGGGLSTLYAHNQSNAISHGQQVNRGDTIAYIGSTGMSTGPHLHFEVRVNGVRVNPMSYFN